MKIKILTMGLVCLFLISCAQKFNETQAEDVIKSSLELTEKDSLQIIGISMETKEVAIVKFELNEVQISSKMRKYDTGWQLDEVQNELGMWIPAENLIQAFSQSEKQKNTMKEITIIATAIVDYIIDRGTAPTQNGAYDENSDFYTALCPFYLKSIPVKDSWGNNFLVYCGTAANGKYGIADCRSDDSVVVSLGRDGKKEVWKFDADSPEAGLFLITNSDDYDKDLIMWNGSWIRAPKFEE